MPDMMQSFNSILVVSNSDRFNAQVKKSISGKGFSVVDISKSVALAQRRLLERNYDLVLIHSPLPDDMGFTLAGDVGERRTSGILVVVPAEIWDDVEENLVDYGICVMPKPIDQLRLDHIVRFFMAIGEKVKFYERRAMKAEEKCEEIRVVSRAKILLMEEKGMNEEEAHKYIGKKAMDNGVSRRRIAEEIIKEY